VNPMHEKPGAGTPYVALFLMLSRAKPKQGNICNHVLIYLPIRQYSK
jgi:hypothetical protein